MHYPNSIGSSLDIILFVSTLPCFPQFSEDGKVTGFYFLAADITERGDLSHDQAGHNAAPADVRDQETEQDIFARSFTEKMSGGKHAASRIIAAIEKDEFHLFCQIITPCQPSPPSLCIMKFSSV